MQHVYTVRYTVDNKLPQIADNLLRKAWPYKMGFVPFKKCNEMICILNTREEPLHMMLLPTTESNQITFIPDANM